MTPERRRTLRHRHLSGGLEVAIRRCEGCERTLQPREVREADGQTYCPDCYIQVYPLCDFCFTEMHWTDLVTVGEYEVCKACAERDETERRDDGN